MPTPANGNKEGEDNTQLLDLKRQLQEIEKTIKLLEHDRNEQQQRREHRQQRDLRQIEAQEEEISNLRQQLNRMQTRTTRETETPTPALTSSAPKVKLDKYDGKSSIVQRWLKFMTFLSLQKLSEAVAIDTLPFYLTGAAESWFFSLDSNIKSLESIRQAIHNRFKPSTRHNLQLMDVKQKEVESVDDFIHRVTSLTTDRSVDQEWLITVIMNGLKPDLSAEVIKADPQTLEDLRNVAARAKMAERRRTTTPALQESTNFALLNALQEIREDVRENRQQHQRRPYYQLAENIPIGQDSMPKDINSLLPDTRFQPMDKLNLQDLLDQPIPINALVLGESFAILIRILFPLQDVIIVEK